MPIREGLARLEGVESISPRPNVKEGTCELRMREGRLLDPQVLSKFIYDIRVGARLRGLEATVAGLLDKQGQDFILRIAGSDEVLRLASLGRRVQQDTATKAPLSPTKSQSNAFKKLVPEWKGKPLAIQITGPLVKTDDNKLTLEVQRFELSR